ncbi:hypothetical protein CSW98_06510 [Vibrio sp. HA2012]|uniref:hypothetical protein n=1 Tax=Vibrio sp. HA2012 TaxID=1971595 RepID=UPI000C2C28E2|nr:hypothetical protein [Vibrio sp. HA2012]PJC86645.1 hypothetical protein CSW98_06510 [Vibrio sp. HA2012]
MYFQYKHLDDFNKDLACGKWLLTRLISSDDSWEFTASPSNSMSYRTLTLWYTGDEWRSFDQGINEDLTVSTPDVPVEQWSLASGELWLKHIDVRDSHLSVSVVIDGENFSYLCDCHGQIMVKSLYR